MRTSYKYNSYSYSDSAIRRRSAMRARKRAMRVKQFAALIVLAALLAILVPSITSYAGGSSAEPSVPTYKYYDSICIMYGDTLTSIAGKYCSKEFKSREAYIDEVKAINHMTDDKLVTGDYIVVPYYSAEERYLEQG